jgi:hypothetical protein
MEISPGRPTLGLETRLPIGKPLNLNDTQTESQPYSAPSSCRH